MISPIFPLALPPLRLYLRFPASEADITPPSRPQLGHSVEHHAVVVVVIVVLVLHPLWRLLGGPIYLGTLENVLQCQNVSDYVIALDYFSIHLEVFGAFIVLCGLTHLDAALLPPTPPRAPRPQPPHRPLLPLHRSSNLPTPSPSTTAPSGCPRLLVSSPLPTTSTAAIPTDSTKRSPSPPRTPTSPRSSQERKS